MNDDNDKYEFTRGSLTQSGLRNAAYALDGILNGMDQGLAMAPELIESLKASGEWEQFQDEHRQVKLVPDFLLNIAEAMDQEIENCGGRDGEVTLKIRTPGSERKPPETKPTTFTVQEVNEILRDVLARLGK